MSFIENKVALITGGASEIGYCYARELLKNGLKGVTLVDGNSIKGEEAVQKLTKEFGQNRAIFVKADVSNMDNLEEVFNKTVNTFKNLDILINNGGVVNDSIWEKDFPTNVNGTIFSCILAMDDYLPKYKSGSEAVIVNISSVSGLQTFEEIPSTPIKNAVIGLSKSLGTTEHYEQTKTRVVTTCPGITSTSNQKPEYVSKELVKIIEKGRNGCFWVIEAGQTYEITEKVMSA